jgi:hypothetical protein
LIYADDVNILRGSEQSTKKDADGLVMTVKENGIEVNAVKTKYMV